MYKTIIIFFLFVSTSWLLAGPNDVPTTQFNDDKGTAVVRKFYEMLTTGSDPAADMDRELFSDSGWFLDKIKDADALPKESSSICAWFRANKDRFLPKDYAHGRNVQLTSTFGFTSSLEKMKDWPPADGNGFVLALLIYEKNPKDKNEMFRTVIFRIQGGKIVADAICFDGFQGQSTYDLVSDLQKN